MSNAIATPTTNRRRKSWRNFSDEERAANAGRFCILKNKTKGIQAMRRIDRRDNRYAPERTVKFKPNARMWEHIWRETNRRAMQWSKAHKGCSLSPISWNALWERVRDELYGTMWACESKREFAEVVR